MMPRRRRPVRTSERADDKLLEVVDRGKDLGGPSGNLGTKLRQCRAGRPALDEHSAEGCLELANLHGEGRLADADCFGGSPEMTRRRQGVQIAKLPQ